MTTNKLNIQKEAVNKSEAAQETAYKGKRIKTATCDALDRFLKKINQDGETGKITFDDVVNYFIENVTEEDIERLQLSTLTWSIEEERIRKLYQKEYGELSNNMWRQYTQTDDFRAYASQHARITPPWELPAQMFQTKGRKKGLHKIIKNDTVKTRSA